MASNRKTKTTAKRKTREPDPQFLLLQYCKGIDEWPESWKGCDLDIRIGEALVEEFKPFLLDRIEKGRSKSTIKKYAAYLWALGGELITMITHYELERKLSARELILKYVDESGGPRWHHARDELDHNRYDSVCRCLYKNIVHTQQTLIEI